MKDDWVERAVRVGEYESMMRAGSDVKDEHKSNDSEDKRDDEGDQTDAGLPTTADPLSTASMDDTFSALRRSSFAGRHRGHHRLTVGKLSHSSPPSRRPEAMPPSA
ncbi:unnamed protein product, partial [Hymenolepis diminuta]|uniref:Uncharacterized protein n=1 Tax=Hymenolepis diminuta TaxID=6216 RepID=A0A0R3SZ25_HYMDI